MIAFGKSLGIDRPPEKTHLRSTLLSLLQGIERDVVVAEQGDYESFRMAVQQAIAAIERDPEEKQALLLVGGFIAAFREYNERVSSLLRHAESERRTAVETIATLERKLAAADAAGGADRQETLDAITGLPGIKAATAALAECQDQRNIFLIAVVANCVRAINSRWGFEAGDHVLRGVAARLSSGLTPKDRVFRWRGPTLIAVVTREAGAEGVRREMTRVWSKTENETIQIGKKSVMIPVVANWSVYPLQGPIGWEQQLECFLASQGVQ